MSRRSHQSEFAEQHARVAELCRHLRSAIDHLEQIAHVHLRVPEPPHHPAPKPLPVTPIPPLSPRKLAYTLQEATVAIGVCRSTLYKAMSKGALPATKLGKRTLIMSDALQAWLASLPRL